MNTNIVNYNANPAFMAGLLRELFVGAWDF